MEHKIALSQASTFEAEAILEKLHESGYPPDSLFLLDDDSLAGGRLAYGSAYLKVLEQSKFDYSTCALLLMPGDDAELAQLAESRGCVVVGHQLSSDIPAVFVGAGSAEPEIPFNSSRVRLAGAELSCLLPLLFELAQVDSIESINTVFLRSAEFHARGGVEELAAQTVNLLNAKAVEPAVFAQQIAFNLLPQGADARFEADLRRFLGNSSYYLSQQSVNVPVFHGLVASLQLRFAHEVAVEDCERRLCALDHVIVKNDDASPISDCNQSFSCVISRLEQTPNQPAVLQFWVITDPMRYGLANNYVNVLEFLLKSFL